MFCLQLDHHLADAVGNLDRVRARRLEDRHRDRRLVVQQRAQRVIRGTEFDPRDVAQPRDFTVGAVLDDDLAELLLGLQPSLRVDGELQVEPGFARRGADHAGRRLHVLRPDLAHHVGGRQATLGDLLRIEPDPHRIVAGAEQLNLADALDARQPVLDVEHGVVAQVGHVVAAVRRQQMHHHGQVRRALDGGDPEGANLRGQSRLGLRHPVLHQLLRLVGIGAEPERDVERHQPVGGGLAAHIEHALDAVDLLLDRRRYRLGDDLGVGARILRAHHHGRRRHFRVFRDRQRRQRQQPRHEDQRRQHAREDRPVDEKSGKVHGTVSSISGVAERNGPGAVDRDRPH